MRFMRLFPILVTLLVACNGEDGLDSLVDVSDEPSGINCPVGGVKIASGIDTNTNGTLEANEITTTKYICDGSNGISTLLTSVAEPAGTSCPGGGTKVQAGKDTNANGTLDPSEIEQTRYICSGVGPREVRIPIGGATTSLGAPFGDPTVPSIATTYIDFDVANYPGYDSIVVVFRDVLVYDGSINAAVPDKDLIFELVNRSDNDTPIVNSKVTVPTGGPYLSKNLYGKIPSGKITLGMRAVSTGADHWGSASTVWLILYDKQ